MDTSSFYIKQHRFIDSSMRSQTVRPLASHINPTPHLGDQWKAQSCSTPGLGEVAGGWIQFSALWIKGAVRYRSSRSWGTRKEWYWGRFHFHHFTWWKEIVGFRCGPQQNPNDRRSVKEPQMHFSFTARSCVAWTDFVYLLTNNTLQYLQASLNKRNTIAFELVQNIKNRKECQIIT